MAIDKQFSRRTLVNGMALGAVIAFGGSLFWSVSPPQQIPSAVDSTERTLAITESALLTRYRKDYPAIRSSVNRRRTHRVIVVLKPGVSVAGFFRSIDGHHFTQQWCLMSPENGRLRLGLDASTTRAPGDLVQQLGRSDLVADVEPGDGSDYLTQVLGECCWRDVHNFGPFTLLAAHISQDSLPRDVERLMGRPTKTSPKGDLQHYENLGGLHVKGLIVVEYRNHRIIKSTFKTVSHFSPPTAVHHRQSSDSTDQPDS